MAAWLGRGFSGLLRAGALLALLVLASGAAAQDLFGPGWDLEPEASTLRFQSVKNTTVVESSSFATFTGAIEPDGTATVTIALDSVDTKVDLRNVRMRFLFFETFQYPEAVVRLKIDPAQIADLPSVRRKILTVPYTVALHGVSRDLTAEIAVTLLGPDLVSVSSATPISLSVKDFALDGGVAKLEEAAGVSIIPSATVTFDFLFARRAGAVPAPQKAAATPAQTALEEAGDFSPEACRGRFEILSRTGNIHFQSGSARLDAKSRPLLDSVADVVRRCPGLVIEVSGHTDSDGGAAANQRLSQARAAAVAEYLAGAGIARERMQVVGYGEDRPVAANDTPANKARNRRIEFAVVGG